MPLSRGQITPPTPIALDGVFSSAYDILHHAATSVDELLQQVQQRKERGDTAVLCGEPSTALLLLGTPFPEWMHRWLPARGVVLCHNMNATTLLSSICTSYFTSRAFELFSAGQLLDAVLDAPRHSALAIGVWKQRAVCVMDYALFDDITPAQHPALSDSVPPDASSARHVTSMRAAHALSKCDADAAARVLNIRSGVVRMFVEQYTSSGRYSREIAPFDRASASPLRASVVQRYALAASFMHMWACEHVVDTVEASLRFADIGDEEPPDLVFVLAPRASVARLRSLSDTARMVSSNLFAEAEQRALRRTDPANVRTPEFAEYELPSKSNSSALANASDVLQATVDITALALDKELHDANLAAKNALLTTIRAKELNFDVTAEICTSINALQRYMMSASCMLVQFDGTGECLVDARVLDALERCAHTFPVRVRLCDFCRVHKVLLPEHYNSLDSSSVEMATQVCSALPAEHFCVGSQYVFLSRQGRDALQIRLTREGVADSRAAEALRTELALERQRLRRAFHEEYAWIHSVHMPHSTGITCASEVETTLLCLFLSSSARNRALLLDAGADLRVSWACVMAVRVLRATGWMNLDMLARVATALEMQNAQGDMRFDMLLHMAELCVLVCNVAPRTADVLQHCNAALCCALHLAAKVYAVLQNRKVLSTLLYYRAPCAVFSDLPALCPKLLAPSLQDYVLPLCQAYTDVHCANAVASAGAMQRDDATQKFIKLHGVDPDSVMLHTRAVLQYRIAQNSKCVPRSVPLLRDEWIANEASSGAQACASPERTTTYSGFSRLCDALPAPALRAFKELCIRSPPQDVCQSVFV
jgi:hypothetical protein